jgi:predicted Fe-Mo cluster-binding NifX family protein
MRVAVASDDGQRIAAHTGRCRGFVIFEVSAEGARRVEERANGFTAHARGECTGESAVHHSHAGLVDALSDCGVLITRGLGPRLVVDLQARGIEAVVCEIPDVDEAAARWAEGTLTRLPGTGCGRHAT